MNRRERPLTDREYNELWTGHLREQASSIRQDIDAGILSERRGRECWRDAVEFWASIVRKDGKGRPV